MRLALLVGLLIAACQLPAFAQAEAPAPEPVAPPDTVAAGAVGRVPLSLAEAISQGIESNTNVQLVRFDPPIADLEHTAAWGVHDPTLYGDYSYQSSNLPVASVFFPDTGGGPLGTSSGVGSFIERKSAGDAGVRGLVPRLGWTYQIGYDGLSNKTNSLVQTLGTTYTSSLTTSVTAPLLKGAWWGSAWTQVQVTGIQSELALEQFRERLIDIVASIEVGYWNLGARKQALEVANKSLETARKLLQQSKAQYDVGVVSRVEVTEAEAGVAQREFDQIFALNRYRDAQDELVDRVYGPRLTPTSQIEIEPTDRPESYVTFDLDPEGSTQRAMAHRPDLAIARQQVEQSEILLKYAKNERLPQVDLVGAYGTHGLSGNDPNCSFTNPGCTPTQPAGVGIRYSDNDDFWFDGNDNRVWLAGAVFSLPIPNTTARANVSISELQLHKAQTNVKRVEQSIVQGVRSSVRNLASALEGIEAAERATAASGEQLRAERIRLEHGESTPFEVLLREQDFVDAERRRIEALQAYHGSVTALDRAQGTLLEDRSIVLDRALPLR